MTIANGAQVRAARGFLGWSQADLAKAAGVSINCVRWWEAKHARQVEWDVANGYAGTRIHDAFLRAGLLLHYDPPSVAVNPDRYDVVKAHLAKGAGVDTGRRGRGPSPGTGGKDCARDDGELVDDTCAGCGLVSRTVAHAIMLRSSVRQSPIKRYLKPFRRQTVSHR